jgi:hypothetical protein
MPMPKNETEGPQWRNNAYSYSENGQSEKYGIHVNLPETDVKFPKSGHAFLGWGVGAPGRRIMKESNKSDCSRIRRTLDVSHHRFDGVACPPPCLVMDKAIVCSQ